MKPYRILIGLFIASLCSVSFALDEREVVDLSTVEASEERDSYEIDTSETVETGRDHIDMSTVEHDEDGQEQAQRDDVDPNSVNQADPEVQQQAGHAASNTGCEQGRLEKVVCANVMCDFGTLYQEWSDECTDWKIKYHIEAAKLKPWDSMPTCMNRDSSCKNDGAAQQKAATREDCEKMKPNERHACLLSLGLGEEDTAGDYLEANASGGSDQIDDDISQIYIDSTPDGQTQQQGDQSYSSNDMEYLIEVIDHRYEHRSLEVIIDEYDVSLQHTVAEATHNFLAARDAGDSQQANYWEWMLTSTGNMRSECATVSNDEFYNCNYYPDLPQQCWPLNQEDQIVQCIDQQVVVMN